jgi:hypothetical protein
MLLAAKRKGRALGRGLRDLLSSNDGAAPYCAGGGGGAAGAVFGGAALVFGTAGAAG